MASTLDIYTGHFGLKERPFALAPDPDYLFWSAQHERAYTMIEYGILTRAPITVITGDIGAGKTTLVHYVMKSMDEDLTFALVSNVQGGRGDLLRWVLQALDQEARGTDYVDLFGQLQDFLIAEYAAGRRTVLIFDEAQALEREMLEELRMLTNINVGKDDLLQLILVGQPELRDNIRNGGLTQLAQRITASFHLTPMEATTVRKYVDHRLKVAGGSGKIFSSEAIKLVVDVSRGVPRLVNQVCDLAMVYAFSEGKSTVEPWMIQNAMRDGAFWYSVDLPESAASQSATTAYRSAT
ncbi:ExeA family protein [Pelagovum sp. HNIBRBA483]|uniref:ExeA family protein n=1 Tax=Pelagovum sp. HNIBRBA483 TaxID=3233341 RepID=UPI0034A3B290